MKILTTGGAGYIGSHTCLELLQAGHEVVAVDNLSNSKAESLKRVQEIAGRSLSFHRADLLDRTALAAVFRSHEIEAVLHDPTLARRELGWQATRGWGEMCADAWRWQSDNPSGYDAS